jgi:hypothetical protein
MRTLGETKSFRLTLLTATLLAVLLAAPAGAQLQTGNVYGLVADDKGNALPGASVVLTGGGAPQERTTDDKGAFRFIGLAPGGYSLAVSLQGFTTMEYPELAISVGHNSQVAVTLPAAVAESITVTSEAPLLDERRVATGADISRPELKKIPTARDPWALLSSVPGVLLDRINVGGNFSGTQAGFVGPGSLQTQAVWSLDGMVITDMAAAGTPPGFFDFESFEDVQVTTGGSDASIATGGVAINMVTRRGTNEWRGSGHFYYADHNFVSRLSHVDLAPASAADNFHAQPAFQEGNRINRVQDAGVELGGPLLRDHLWAWGSYTDPQTDLLTIDDYQDNTSLKAWNVKLNGQLTPANSATFFAWNDEKTKHGVGAGPLRPPETTQNQSRFGDRPTALKLEDTQILGASLYLDGLVSKVNGGVQFLPEGGDKAPYQDDDSIWHNSYFLYKSSRPQKQGRISGSGFFNTGRLSHELKFGAGYRVVEVGSLSSVPGGGETCCGNLLFLTRSGITNFRSKYTSAFLQDTLTGGRLTANLGVRYDRQQGRNLPTLVPANEAFPDLLPAVSDPGGEIGFQWTDVVPRLGVTWAVDEKRKTLLRASYSRYADQLDTLTAGWLDPVQSAQYLYFYTANVGSPVLRQEDLLGPSIGATSGINPLTLGALQSRGLDPNLRAPVVDEVILGIDHALLPDLVIGLQGMYKHYTRLLDQELLVFDDPDAFSEASLAGIGRKVRRDDYVPATPITVTGSDGKPYTIQYYDLRPGVSTRGGSFLENGPREQVYKALFLTLNKRLANRWMMRGNVTWQDWRWRIPKGAVTNANPSLLGGQLDGTPVISGHDFVSGPQPNVFINSKWSYSLTGLYQVAPDRPWGFNLAGSLTGRQGYPLRYARRIFVPTLNVVRPSDLPITTRVDAFRYPDVHVLNLRAEKEVRIKHTGVTFGVDLFNALNSATVLQRQGILGRNNGSYVTELLGQRVYRLSLRLDFR